MSDPSDAEVIRRSASEPEAFGLVYDRHAAALLRFLGRRAGAKIAEGLVGDLFRIAFERRKAFDTSRESALPWLYGIGSYLLLKHRRSEARRLRGSARMAADSQPKDRRMGAAALDARVSIARVADAIELLPNVDARRDPAGVDRTATRRCPGRRNHLEVRGGVFTHRSGRPDRGVIHADQRSEQHPRNLQYGGER